MVWGVTKVYSCVTCSSLIRARKAIMGTRGRSKVYSYCSIVFEERNKGWKNRHFQRVKMTQ